MIRVGLLVPDFGNPFFASLAQSATRILSSFDAACLCATSEGDADAEEDAIDALLEAGVAGLLVVPIGRGLQAPAFALGSPVPLVVLDRAIDDGEVDCVRGDNQEGMKALVRHLRELGHTSLGFIAGPDGAATAEERLDGFSEECHQLRCEIASSNLFEGDFTFGAGSRVAEELLLRGRDTWPTAIVAANDLMAVGLMRKLEEHRGTRVAVPGDLSVAGFDDMPLAGAVSPKLTTVRQNVRKIATTGARLLIHRIHEEAIGMHSQPVTRVVKPELVRRDSTQPCLPTDELRPLSVGQSA